MEVKTVLLDTNVLIMFLRNPDAFVDRLSAYERVLLNPVVVGEFKAGITSSRRGKENSLALEDFLLNPAVDELPITAETSAVYAKIFQELKKKGTPIPTNDIWIAASSIEAGCDLITNDAHFRQIAGISLI